MAGSPRGTGPHVEAEGRHGTAATNARTRDKHDILAGVVARFEKRLGELKSYVTGTGPAKAAAAKPKRSKAGKPAAKKANASQKTTVAKKRSRP